jgi:transcriptional regulator of arginine metabolism
VRRSGQGRTAQRERQRQIRELVARMPIGSQLELVEQLRARGFSVTQATVSRDIAQLGLVKATRGDRQVYVSPEDLAAAAPVSDDGLRRILGEVPVSVGRSGLTLVLTGRPGTAGAIAEGIDRSSLHEQEGTLAGDNTILVLFADEPRLERWLARFRELQGLPGLPAPGALLGNEAER